MRTPEYRVRITVRNNLLLSAIERAGFRGYGSLGRFAASAGIALNDLGPMLSLRRSPINRDGEFCTVAKALMEALGAAPGDLWTDRQMIMSLRRNTGESLMTETAVQYLLDEHVSHMTLPDPAISTELSELKALTEKTLSNLTQREENVIRARFFRDQTLEDVATAFGCSVENIRRLEAKALRKLRQQKYAADLKTFAEVSDP